VHTLDPVATRNEVPGLHEYPKPGLLQFPGDPFRPRPIGLGVRDEEVPTRVSDTATRHDTNPIPPASPAPDARNRYPR
jgi:hypothetical protein